MPSSSADDSQERGCVNIGHLAPMLSDMRKPNRVRKPKAKDFSLSEIAKWRAGCLQTDNKLTPWPDFGLKEKRLTNISAGQP